ncbi:hypothetical protein D3C86_1193750 [compost metagenome]
MEPIQVIGITRIARRRGQRSLAVLGKNVFDDGGGFRQHDIAVRDDRRGAQWVQGLVLGRRQPRGRVPFIGLQFIRDGKFFAQPYDALGLRFSQMVDDQHDGGSFCWCTSGDNARRQLNPATQRNRSWASDVKTLGQADGIPEFRTVPSVPSLSKEPA